MSLKFINFGLYYDNIKNTSCKYINLIGYGKPILPESLRSLSISHINIIDIDYRTIWKLTSFHYGNTPFQKQIKETYDDNLDHYCSYWRTYFKDRVVKIEYWFLDCKYNPKYKYCRNRLEKEYEDIYEA